AVWCGIAVFALLSMPAFAQVSPKRLAAMQKRLNQILTAYNKMPSKYQKMLDGNANAVALAKVFPRVAPNLAKPHVNVAVAQADLAAASPTNGIARVNNPGTDLQYSAFAGYTQSETSTAKCGNSVVVGFNDSNSYFQTLINGTGGAGFSGYAWSTDGGKTFTD